MRARWNCETVSYETILVATDGSRRTDRAIAHAVGLAERCGATLHALSVVDLQSLSFDEEGFSTDERTRRTLERFATDAVETVEVRADGRGVETVTAVRSGSPAAEVRRYAREEAADIVVVGTRGRRGIQRRLLGSVAGRVLARSPCPVLTARAAPSREADAASPVDVEYDDVLVPVDGSEAADRTLDHALDVADRYDATVHALSVIDTGLALSPQLLAALEEVSERTLKTAKRRAEDEGVAVRTSVWRGSPADCVRGYVDQHGVDFVAIGSHERRGLDRFLRRTVAQRVVPTVDSPVLSVRTAEES